MCALTTWPGLDDYKGIFLTWSCQEKPDLGLCVRDLGLYPICSRERLRMRGIRERIA